MKYATLISKLTLEEKASLLSRKGNFTTKEIDRLGIPSAFLSDGPHGLRKQAGAADHLGLNASLPATCYPTAATMANSWDVALGEALGTHLGAECVAQRVNMLLGPGLNMKRSPLCGRAFEYFSEDPYLAGKLAAAYIRGIQSKGVSACPKHFAVNSQETLRMSSDSVVDERTLRELYLTGFEIAVKEGHPRAIMSSYNKINGVYANENKKLLKDVLVDEWGFDGVVVSDWGGSNDHVAGVAAGSHLEMPAPGATSDLLLVKAVEDGTLDESLLDQRVETLLNMLFSTAIAHTSTKEFDVDAHHAFARKAAGESIVLLKNEKNLLPLSKGTRIAVLGDFAQTPCYQGAGSSMVNPTRLENALDCLRESCLEVVGFQPGFLRSGKEDAALREDAVALAKEADVALLYLGLAEVAECEGMDRPNMCLPKNQGDLVTAVSAVNPNVVVVLSGGSAIELPWLDQAPAILHGYLGGQAGAAAMVDILTGGINPSGKLAESWPIRYEDTPAYRYFPGTERTAEYREGPFIGYRYYGTAGVPVRFPFGFGLSYTTFAYKELKVSEHSVDFTINNTGSVAGAEICQVYVGKEDSSLFHPAKELKGFFKAFLQPGEEQRISIPLDDKAFRSFLPNEGKWRTEGGVYQIYVAASSEDIRLSGKIRLADGMNCNPYEGFRLPSYRSGRVSNVANGEFECLLGRPVPRCSWDRTRPLERNDTVSQLCYAKSGMSRFLFRRIAAMKSKSDATGTPDLNLYSIYNMPFRGIAKLMGSAVDLDMVDGILTIVNGRFWRGLGQLFRAWRRKRKTEKIFQQHLAVAGKEGE